MGIHTMNITGLLRGLNDPNVTGTWLVHRDADFLAETPPTLSSH